MLVRLLGKVPSDQPGKVHDPRSSGGRFFLILRDTVTDELVGGADDALASFAEFAVAYVVVFQGVFKFLSHLCVGGTEI